MKLPHIIALGLACLLGYLTAAGTPATTAGQLNPASAAPTTLETFHPANVHAAECSCNCPDASAIRSIVREELTAFRTQYPATYHAPVATGSSGSTGGHLSPVGRSTVSQPPPVADPEPVVVCDGNTCRIITPARTTPLRSATAAVLSPLRPNATSSLSPRVTTRWQPVRNLLRGLFGR